MSSASGQLINGSTARLDFGPRGPRGLQGWEDETKNRHADEGSLDHRLDSLPFYYCWAYARHIRGRLLAANSLLQ